MRTVGLSGAGTQVVEDHFVLVELGPPPATTGLILLRTETANGQFHCINTSMQYSCPTIFTAIL